jgi:hypothetical protein
MSEESRSQPRSPSGSLGKLSLLLRILLVFLRLNARISLNKPNSFRRSPTRSYAEPNPISLVTPQRYHWLNLRFSSHQTLRESNHVVRSFRLHFAKVTSPFVPRQDSRLSWGRHPISMYHAAVSIKEADISCKIAIVVSLERKLRILEAAYSRK